MWKWNLDRLALMWLMLGLMVILVYLIYFRSFWPHFCVVESEVWSHSTEHHASSTICLFLGATSAWICDLSSLSIGTLKAINFSFVPKSWCPNIYAQYIYHTLGEYMQISLKYRRLLQTTPKSPQTTSKLFHSTFNQAWQTGGGSFLLLPRRHALSSRWLWAFNHSTCENRLEEIQGAETSSLFPPPSFQDTWPCVQLVCAERNAPCQWNLASNKARPLASAAKWQSNDQTDMQLC